MALMPQMTPLQAANVAAEILCTMLELVMTYLIDGMFLSVDMQNLIVQPA